MARLTLYDQESGQVVPYPRWDDRPVEQLDPRYLILSVREEPKPDFNPELYRAEQVQKIDLESKTLSVSWRLSHVPNWSLFKLRVMTDSLVNRDLQQGFGLAPGATLSLPLVVQNVSTQNGNKEFRTVWLKLRRAGVISSETISAVSQIAHECNLPEDFIRVLGGRPRPAAESLGQEWSDPAGCLWRVVQVRRPDGRYESDNPQTPEKESLTWVRVEES